ncbi:MAG: hypothetical protein N3D76_01475 [Geminocystis sp.]|nr:hypothetical protein [Geminocystis sp.]
MKDNPILWKWLLHQAKNQEAGVSLMELIVALVIGGITLVLGAVLFVNVLRANKAVESKTVAAAELQRALSFIVEDIKLASNVTMVNRGNTYCPTSQVDSNECLVLRRNENGTVYVISYGYKDIQNQNTHFYKPGVLKRQVYRQSDNTPVSHDYRTLPVTGGQQAAWDDYTTVADGLINTTPRVSVACENFEGIKLWQDSSANSNRGQIYGDTSDGRGGVRFCLYNTAGDNRLARVFLIGRTVDERDSEFRLASFGLARN